MSLLNTVKTDATVVEAKDILGGGGAVDAAIYPAKIDIAYLEQSKGGALALVAKMKLADGRNYMEKLWFQSGNAKGNLTTYMDKQNIPQHLPGFTTANSVCRLTVGKELTDMATEEKLVGIYNYAAKSELPTKVEVLTELTGQELYLGIKRQTVNKNVLNDAGAYVPGPDTRDENLIDKVFRASDKLTTAEILAHATESAFFDAWSKKNTGVVEDRTSKAAGGAGSAGSPAATTGKPATSLFT
jgi:hypothetical protein